DPRRTWDFSGTELRLQLVETLPWFGAVFAGMYTALYARFASQWGYLAGVYNQIKAAECRGQCDANALAEWKAGFIEDAQELHLATKPAIASILSVWGRQPNVKAKFIETVAGKERRLALLMDHVNAAVSNSARRFSVMSKLPSKTGEGSPEPTVSMADESATR
ncbi:MAG: hypothetical protein ACRD3C_19900, partial [Vicinamibacterales bacterium]